MNQRPPHMPDRRLAAILAADIVGYSALMAEDEAGMLEALRRFRGEVFHPSVAGHRGQVVKSMGDGWLVEFASAVDAVTCAMQVQDRLAGHAKIRLRIGVHLGDITHEADDVFGDGVNVAARLEGLAEPGSVVISDAVHGSLDGTLRPSFDDQGSQNLKNIGRPVRIWVRGGAIARRTGADAGAGGDLPRLVISQVTSSDAREEVRELAAGLTSDLASYLGGADWLSVSTDRDAAPTAYLLEASLRSRGDRLRLEARLAGPDGAPLWSGKFDGRLEDSFDWQDEVGEDAAAQVVGLLLDREKQRLAAKPIDQMSAEECYLNGNLWFALVDRQSMRQALTHYSAAIEKRPDFVRAYCAAIVQYHSSRSMGLTDVVSDFADAFRGWLVAAEPLAATDPMLELYIAIATRTPGDSSRLRRAIQSALRQMPFVPDVVLFCGAGYVWMGDPEPALDCFRERHKLHRFGPFSAALLSFWALAAVMSGRDDEAITAAEKGLRQTTGFATLYRALAAAYAHAGRMDEARAAAARVLELLPEESIEFGRRRSNYPDTPGTRRYFDGLRLAGIPEGDE